VILDAALAYLHFTAIFVLFAFLTTQVVLLRTPLDARGILLLGRTDIWYASSAAAVLATGVLRLWLGPKGAEFYLGAWPLYAKVGLFLVVGLISVKPTIEFFRWRAALKRDPAWRLAPERQAAMRRIVMLEVHLAALIPVFAVIMARGLGHG
jgi:putative membrane protein